MAGVVGRIADVGDYWHHRRRRPVLAGRRLPRQRRLAGFRLRRSEWPGRRLPDTGLTLLLLTLQRLSLRRLHRHRLAGRG